MDAYKIYFPRLDGTTGEFILRFISQTEVEDAVQQWQYRDGKLAWWRWWYEPGPLEAQIRKLEGRE